MFQIIKINLSEKASLESAAKSQHTDEKAKDVKDDAANDIEEEQVENKNKETSDSKCITVL